METKVIFRHWLHVLAACLMLAVTMTAMAQTTFSARVIDAETGEALPLVGVYISEENNTLTNFDGEFSIIADSLDIIRLTCIGSETMTMSVSKLPSVIRMKMF